MCGHSFAFLDEEEESRSSATRPEEDDVPAAAHAADANTRAKRDGAIRIRPIFAVTEALLAEGVGTR